MSVRELPESAATPRAEAGADVVARVRPWVAWVALAVIVVVAVAVRLERAWEPAEVLLHESTYDDAYYYFKIADNVSDGEGVTFDGETVTNGFHPLWLALIEPFFLVTEDKDLAVELSLTLATALRAATIVLIFAIVRRMTKNAAAALVPAAYYALHPYIIGESLNGVETALVTFTMALAFWQFLRIVEMESAGSRDYVLFGVAGGLLVLSRTDVALVLLPMALYLLWRERRGAWARRGVEIGGVALLVVSPWIAWNLWEFGTIVQVSGLAGGEPVRQAFEQQHGDAVWPRIEESVRQARVAFYDRMMRLYVVPSDSARLPAIGLVVALLVAMVAAPLRLRGDARRWLLLLAVPASGVIAGLLFHSMYRWHVREWYYGPAGLMIALFLGMGVAYVHGALRELSERWRGDVRGEYARWLVPALYAVTAVVLLAVYSPLNSDRWENLPRALRRPQVNLLEGARWLNANTEEDARIGAMNSGIIGYYTDRTVVNLDGVVNDEAYYALRDYEMALYVKEKRLDYVADFPPVIFIVATGGDGTIDFERVATVGEDFPFPGGPVVDVHRVVIDE